MLDLPKNQKHLKGSQSRLYIDHHRPPMTALQFFGQVPGRLLQTSAEATRLHNTASFHIAKAPRMAAMLRLEPSLPFDGRSNLNVHEGPRNHVWTCA